MTSKYRLATAAHVVGISLSYQRENLFARGFGLEHLRELLLRLARPLLRNGASLAFAGHWREAEDNFTYDLLRLISAEQEDNSLGGPETDLTIGRLYNHSPWPDYLAVTPHIEAQWINCCRVVRITQEHAAIAPADRVADADAHADTDRVRFNTAVVLSAMRRLAMDGLALDIPDLPSPENIPGLSARVLLGGKMQGYTGFLPGLFEEALVALERQAPLYVFGGFGGAAEVLARMLLAPVGDRPPELTLDWHKAGSPNVTKLLELSGSYQLPAGIRSTAQGLDDLFAAIEQARPSLAAGLNTGLDEAQTRELLTTRDMGRAVKLALEGLSNRFGFVALPG
jgi:hypothetical protein